LMPVDLAYLSIIFSKKCMIYTWRPKKFIKKLDFGKEIT